MQTLNDLYTALINRGFRSCGKEQLTVAGTAVGLSSIPSGAIGAICVVESTVTDQAEIVVRYLENGDTPTSGVGMPCNHFTNFTISSAQDLTKFKAIQAQAGTHKINIEYFK